MRASGYVRGPGRYYGRYPRYGYWHRPYGGWFWGYPGVWGAGAFVSYWDPLWYRPYSSYWIGGVPAYGFGTVYYGPTYNDYFVAEEPVYGPPIVAEEVMPEGAPLPAVEDGPVAPPAEELPPEDAPPPADDEAPGLQAFDAGVKAFRDGDFEKSLANFREATQAEPDNGELWMALAHAGFAEGEFDDAAQGIARAAELGGFPRGYRFDPRPVYPSAETFDGALANLEKYRELKPDDVDAALTAAYFYTALGQRDKASQAIVRTLQLRPDDPTAPLLNQALLPPGPPTDVPQDERATGN